MQATPISPIQKKLIRLHFYLLLVILLNALCKFLFSIGLVPIIILPLKIIFCLLGLLLFFFIGRPFKLISLYFSLFLITPLLALLSLAFAGIGGAIVLSLLLLPFNEPAFPTLTSGRYTIDTKYEGFFGTGMHYEVFRHQNILFLHKLGTIETTPENFGKASFLVHDRTVYLKIEQTVNQDLYQKDSLMVNGKWAYQYKPISKTEYKKDTTLLLPIR